MDALAHAFQLELTNCIQECCRNGVAFHNTAAGPALLRLAISAACSGSSFVNRSLPLTMLGDVFENQTSSQAEQLFTLVEDSISQLARLLVNDQGVAGSERYIIIKAFNALLKRLCRSSQLVLAGRILMFLSSVFPLSEPSGLNKKGAFNTENATAFEAEEELSAAAAASAVQGVPGESSMGDDGTDGVAVTDTSGGTECSVDAAFYQTLWSSQRYFKEPQLLQNTTEFEKFIRAMDSVIETFNKSPLPKGEDSSYAAALRNIDFFAPKFLTSSKLLGLQLKDVSMRRQLLLQMIVLLSHIKDGKSFSPELPPFKMDKVKTLQEKAFAALASVPPAGPKFVARVKLLLQRDVNWVEWKRLGCPSFELPPLPPSTIVAAQASAPMKPISGKVEFFKPKKRFLSSAMLQQLQSTGAVEPWLKQLQGGSLPKTTEWFMNAIRDEIENEVDVADRRSSTMGFIWAGARALRRTHLGRFMKLKADTAWLEGTLFEIDNPGQSAPKRLKPSEATNAEDSKPISAKAELDNSAAADAAAPAEVAPADAAPAIEAAPEVADCNSSSNMQ